MTSPNNEAWWDKDMYVTKGDPCNEGADISWDIPLILSESRYRFKEEAVKALEGAPGHTLEPASSDGIFYDEASFNAGHRLAKQAAIEAIKKL